MARGKRSVLKTKRPDPPAADPAATLPVKSIQQALLAWYRAHHRKMPWRADPGTLGNPYHVFVSEAMLQQTQVATVIEYFNRFVTTLPTIEALAGAPEQQVLRLWQGLGYYRRARHLHAAAKAIVSEHGGNVPNTVDALLELPGVGRYTAGAVASIAFGKSAPILDGNVARVLARWTALREPIDEPKVREKLWSIAEIVVPEEVERSNQAIDRTKDPQLPGDFNQAMMELGAMVCTPRAPRCLTCPVAKYCQAFEQGIVEQVPVRLPKRAPRAVEHHILAVQRKDEFLFRLRPTDGLWAGMWELPTFEPPDASATPKNSAAIEEAALIDWFSAQTGLTIASLKKIDSFSHATTHRAIRFVLWSAGVTTGRLQRDAGVWRDLAKLDDLPLSNPQRRAVKLLQLQLSR